MGSSRGGAAVTRGAEAEGSGAGVRRCPSSIRARCWRPCSTSRLPRRAWSPPRGAGALDSSAQVTARPGEAEPDSAVGAWDEPSATGFGGATGGGATAGGEGASTGLGTSKLTSTGGGATRRRVVGEGAGRTRGHGPRRSTRRANARPSLSWPLLGIDVDRELHELLLAQEDRSREPPEPCGVALSAAMVARRSSFAARAVRTARRSASSSTSVPSTNVVPLARMAIAETRRGPSHLSLPWGNPWGCSWLPGNWTSP